MTDYEAKPIAAIIDYESVAWCETCREAFAPSRDVSEFVGVMVALRIWVARHNLAKHPRRARYRRVTRRTHHEGDCR